MADLHNFPRGAAQAPLPALLDLEQALLGAILINNAALGYVSGILKPEHFTEPFHAEIYRRCLTEVAEGRVVTPLTLNASFPDMKIGEITGAQYFARLAAEATTVINAHDYAAMLRAISDMREFILLGDDLRNARDFLHSPIEALTEAWRKLDLIRVGGEDNTIDRAAVTALADRMLDIREGTAIPTGLYDLDSTIGGGYRTKRLIVCGGRPGMAKTAKMCSLARRIAMNGTGVSIFSLETDQHELMARLVADELARTDWNIAYRDIIAGEFKGLGERDRVMTGASRIKELPIRLDWSSGLSMADIEARARLDQQRFARNGVKLGLVCIDHLGLVKVTDRYRGRRVDELGEVTLAAKNIAKRLDVAVLALVQLSRAVENRDDKMPMLSDLRDSGNIEEHADFVELLYRPAYYLERKTQRVPDPKDLEALDRQRYVMKLIIAKNRLGPAKTIDLFCNPGLSAIDNAARY
jgi:replicative DNA helicase